MTTTPLLESSIPWQQLLLETLSLIRTASGTLSLHLQSNPKAEYLRLTLNNVVVHQSAIVIGRWTPGGNGHLSHQKPSSAIPFCSHASYRPMFAGFAGCQQLKHLHSLAGCATPRRSLQVGMYVQNIPRLCSAFSKGTVGPTFPSLHRKFLNGRDDIAHT